MDNVRVPIRLTAQRKNHAKTDTTERKPGALHVEAMIVFKDDGECLECKVDDSEDDG